MKNHKETILMAMDSTLSSAQIEALSGTTLKKFLLELNFLWNVGKNRGGKIYSCSG